MRCRASVRITFGEKMNTKRYTMSIVATLALSLYVFATWSEAAYYASSIEFNELLTWNKMLPAFAAVRLINIVRLSEAFILMEITAVMGMLASIGIGTTSSWRPPMWAVASYTGVFLLVGGWVGIFVPLFLFQPLDGEFLDEGMARMTACGLWLIILICYIINWLTRDGKKTEPIGAR